MTINAQFTDGENQAVTDGLWQYDRGQKLCVSGVAGISGSTEVHFGYKPGGRALVKTGEFDADNGTLTVDIPDIFLEFSDGEPSKAWLYVLDSVTQKNTVREILIPIRRREQPDDYISEADIGQFAGVERAVGSYFETHPELVRSYVTPEMFGALGDGRHDDSNELQAAVNAAIAGKLPFRAAQRKTYLITKTIDIDIDFPEYYIGEFDFGGSCIKAADNTELESALHYKTNDYPVGRSWYKHAKVTLKNLVIDGNGENIHTGLYVERSYGAVFEKIHVYDTRRGILVKSSTESILRDCSCRRDASLDLKSQLAENRLKHPRTFYEESEDSGGTVNVVRAEQLEDGTGFIDPDKTLCVGFEFSNDDGFVEDCVAVDYAVGLRIKGSDNKISGCHIWNTSMPQIYSSVCFYVAGINYFVNNTCDHFRIGFYFSYSSVSQFVNTHFTNQDLVSSAFATKGELLETQDSDSYCWYVGDKYMWKNRGAAIKAVNTKVRGNFKIYQKRRLYWCNMENSFVNDGGTTEGAALYGYLPDKPESDDLRFCRVEQAYTCEKLTPQAPGDPDRWQYSGGVIPVLEECKLGLTGSAGDRYAVGEHLYKNGLISVNGTDFSTQLTNGGYVHTLGKPAQGRTRCRFLIGTDSQLKPGHKYMLQFMYKNSLTTDGTTPSAEVRVYNSKSPSSRSLVTDAPGSETLRIFTAVFEARDYDGENGLNNTIVGIEGYRDITAEIISHAQNSNEILQISELSVWDITCVPRYLMESRAAYEARLISALNVPMDDKQVDIQSDMAFVSLRHPLNFDETENAGGVERLYEVRYDAKGHPVIRKNELGLSGAEISTVARIPADSRMLCFDAVLASEVEGRTHEDESDMTDKTKNSDVDVNFIRAKAFSGSTRGVYYSVKNKYDTVVKDDVITKARYTLQASNPQQLVVPRESGGVKLQLYYLPDYGKDFTVLSLTVDDELKCNCAVIDSEVVSGIQTVRSDFGKTHAVYRGGEIYAVKKSTSGDFTAPLPTVVVNTAPSIVFETEPTTLKEIGITDAYTKAEVDSAIQTAIGGIENGSY